MLSAASVILPAFVSVRRPGMMELLALGAIVRDLFGGHKPTLSFIALLLLELCFSLVPPFV